MLASVRCFHLAKRVSKMPKTKHLIENYDLVLKRFTELNQQHKDANKTYWFAVGDLFNQNVPAGINNPEYVGSGGLNAIDFQKLIGEEIDALIEQSGFAYSRMTLANARRTARSWKKDERVYDVCHKVYSTLHANKELMRDGLTVDKATELLNTKKGLITLPRSPRSALKPVQVLKFGLNMARKVLDMDALEPTPELVDLVQQGKELFGELEARLQDIEWYDSPELVAA